MSRQRWTTLKGAIRRNRALSSGVFDECMWVQIGNPLAFHAGRNLRPAGFVYRHVRGGRRAHVPHRNFPPSRNRATQLAREAGMTWAEYR